MTQNLILEGVVTEVKPWEDKGKSATFVTDYASYIIGFSGKLRVPRKNVRVRVKAVQGNAWLFAESWEYLEKPEGRTRDGFPVKGCPELERKAWDLIRSRNEFTADDLHILEADIEAKNRDRRVIGSILRKLQIKGLIKPVRIVHSKREECHRRPLTLWTRTVELGGFKE